MKKIFSNPYTRGGVFLTAGLFLGWMLFHTPGHNKEESHLHMAEEAKNEVWTCSMHPHIKMDKPGKCPICAMDLIPLSTMTSGGSDQMAIHFTKEAAQLANVQVTAVSIQNPENELRLYGKVVADERLLQNQVSHLSGRIEKLLVNFTGEPVTKGQKLAVIYSPELVTAQQELLEAARTKNTQPELYEATKEKLRLWKLSEKQISTIENSGKTEAYIEIEASTSGIVTDRRVNMGDYVNPGTILYQVSDLSRVWVLFDAYESDLPFIKQGDKVTFTVQALPGTTFEGTIRFIDPVMDPVNRVAKVRVEIGNPGGRLKPEMFAVGVVRSNLGEFRGKVVVPASAVLWTGKRSVVYVKQMGNEPIFHMREVELGPKAGDSYVILSGLNDGEEVVTSGAFSVDAAAQLEGKPSMMNPEGGAEVSGHNHGEMNQGEYAEIRVGGNCDMCKERIETVAKSVNGLTSAVWDVETKLLHLNFNGNKSIIDEVQKVIARAGHDTEKYKAPDDVYKSLPECCLYDRFKY